MWKQTLEYFKHKTLFFLFVTKKRKKERKNFLNSYHNSRRNKTQKEEEHTHSSIGDTIVKCFKEKNGKRKLRKKKTPDKNQQTLTMHFYNKKKQTKKNAKNCKIKLYYYVLFFVKSALNFRIL